MDEEFLLIHRLAYYMRSHWLLNAAIATESVSPITEDNVSHINDVMSIPMLTMQQCHPMVNQLHKLHQLETEMSSLLT